MESIVSTKKMKNTPIPPSIEKAINEADSLRKLGKYSEALDLLENRLLEIGKAVTSEEKRYLHLAIADTYLSWAEAEVKGYAWNDAILHYRAAYEIDKTERIDHAAISLDGIGEAYYSIGETDKALDFFKKALPLWQKVGGKQQEAATLSNIGASYSSLGDIPKALAFLNQALMILRQIGDRQGEAATLNNIGMSYRSLREYDRALETLVQALPPYKQSGDKHGEAIALNNIGLTYSDLKEYERAFELWRQALPLYKQSGDKHGEANLLNNIGLTYSDLGEQSKVIEFLIRALPLYKQVGDKQHEGLTYTNIGKAYWMSGEKTKALEYYSRALSISKQIGDKRGEARTLNNIGTTYSDLGKVSQALEYFNQALPIYRHVSNKQGEAITLNNIGRSYLTLGEITKALYHYNQSLVLSQQLGSKKGEVDSFNNLGSIYSEMGEKSKALEYYGSALSISKQIGDKEGEARTLNNIGRIHSDLGEQSKALEFLIQALTIYKQVGDKQGEEAAYNNIGRAYRMSEDKTKALEYYSQSLSISKQIGDKYGEHIILSNIGWLHSELNQVSRALEVLNKALLVSRQTGDKQGEANILSRLMYVWKNATFSRKSPATAVLLGKQAAIIYQNLRDETQNLGRQIQQTFAYENDIPLQTLATILAQQQRLPEALEIYLLLNRQKPSESGATTYSETLTLNHLEANILQDYNRYGKLIGKITSELAFLTQLRNPTAQQTIKRNQLDASMKREEDNFITFLKHLPNRFKDGKPHLAKNPSVVSDFYKSLHLLQAQTGHKTSTVLSMLFDDMIFFLVVKNQKIALYNTPIKKSDLEKKISDFRIALTALDRRSGLPLYNPQSLARKLYDILIKPIAKDIAGCQQVFWALDGKLRYIPIAALHDGKQYLVEKPVRHTLFIAESVDTLAKKPTATPKLLACATSKAHKTDDYSFEALPGVQKELAAIKPTRALPDKAFTRDSFLSGLKGRYPIVHLATHFALKPGNLYNSFVLLGDGTPLRLSEINDLPDDLFAGVDLLTLSACETGNGMATANGTELESFGYLAQRKGAAAVLSTLWPVNDASTAALMARFYGSLGKVGPGGKAEALRLAQVALLTGVERPDLARRAPEAGQTLKAIEAPAFNHNPNAPAAHPYYWAPFTLLGNPR